MQQSANEMQPAPFQQRLAEPLRCCGSLHECWAGAQNQERLLM